MQELLQLWRGSKAQQPWPTYRPLGSGWLCPSRRSRDVEVEKVQELGQRGEEQLVAATSGQPVGRQGAVGSPPGEV